MNQPRCQPLHLGGSSLHHGVATNLVSGRLPSGTGALQLRLPGGTHEAGRDWNKFLSLSASSAAIAKAPREPHLAIVAVVQMEERISASRHQRALLQYVFSF